MNQLWYRMEGDADKYTSVRNFLGLPLNRDEELAMEETLLKWCKERWIPVVSKLTWEFNPDLILELLKKNEARVTIEIEVHTRLGYHGELTLYPCIYTGTTVKIPKLLNHKEVVRWIKIDLLYVLKELGCIKGDPTVLSETNDHIVYSLIH